MGLCLGLPFIPWFAFTLQSTYDIVSVNLTYCFQFHLCPHCLHLSSCDSASVWSDWAILKSSWQQIFFSKKHNYLATFWAILKYVTFYEKNCFGYFLGNFWKIWVTFNSNIWSHCSAFSLSTSTTSALSCTYLPYQVAWSKTFGSNHSKGSRKGTI